MWLDLDDEIEGAENIPQAIEYMEPLRLDVVLFQYDYYRNERDETEALQWRERIIRTNSQLKWVDLACHEYVYAPYGARVEQLAGISIRHRKTAEHIQESTARNRRLLEKDWLLVQNPRTAYYLGKTYLHEGSYDTAIDMLLFAAKNSEGDTDEDKIQAWLALAECCAARRTYDQALWATDQALNLDPSHPEPWYQKVIIYTAQGLPQKTVEFADIAL